MKVFILLLCLGGGPSFMGSARGETTETETPFTDASVESTESRSIEIGTSSDNSLTPAEQAMLEELVDHAIAQEELLRSRRSGQKLDKINRLSSYDHHPNEYGPPAQPLSYGTKSFSVWSFKKMILNALLQAVKAITGGVIALKGQLVKVKGHLVAAKGKFLETKGDAITEFGKHLATKALLTPVHVSNYDHSDSGKPSYPAAPPSSYGPPNHQPPPPVSSYGAPAFPHGPYPPAGPPSSYAAPPPQSYLPEQYMDYQGFPPTMFGHQVQGDWSHQSLKRDTADSKKGQAADGTQAGIIVLKPIRDIPQPENVYRPPQAFSKSSATKRRDAYTTYF